MKIQNCILVIVCIALSANTCGPLTVNTLIKNQNSTIDNEIHLDNIILMCSAKHQHYVGKTVGLKFRISIINNNRNSIEVKNSLLSLKSDGLKYSGEIIDFTYNDEKSVVVIPNTDTLLTVLPGDTLTAFYLFSSNFRGSYNKFKDTLNNSRISFHVNNIFLDKKEIFVKDLELIPIID